MSKLSKALFSFSAKGSLGKALSFRRKGSQTIAEKMPVPEDAKSLAQLSWRHMYQKAVALWHLLSTEEKEDWESKARPRHMTGFAWFMSQCLKPNPGIYLPLQGGTMQGDIDMASHKILKLPAPTDDQEPATKEYVIPKSLLTTQGDIITRNAAIPKRLALGPAGYFLKAGVNEPEWAALTRVTGEGHITILPVSYDSIGQGVWTFFIDATYFLNGMYYNSSNTDGDNLSWKVYLDAGTYTLLLLCGIFEGGGIIDFDVDDVEVASFDSYFAVPIPNTRKAQTSISIATPGLKTLKARIDGKHASSAGYQLSAQYIALWRTA